MIRNFSIFVLCRIVSFSFFIIFVCTFFAYADINDGLVGHWNLDNDSGLDSSGVSNNGIVNGAMVVSGKMNGALRFDGVDDKIIVAHQPSLSAANITLSFWIYPTTSGTTKRIIDKGTGAYLIRRLAAGNKIEFVPGFLKSASAVGQDQWTHVTLTASSTGHKIYINGVEDFSNTTPYNPSGTSALYIGGNLDPFAGLMDDVRIYNRVLTQADIVALCNLGGCPVVSSPPVDSPDLPTDNESLPGGNVYYVSSFGSDQNLGTKDLPFKTIQKCADIVKSGDTCYVLAGSYNEYVSTKSGGLSDNNRITFQAQGLATTQGFAIKHPYVTVQGFDVTGYTRAYSGNIVISSGGSNCKVINNKIRNGAKSVYGILFDSSNGRAASNCVVRGNTLSDLNYMFISMSSSTNNILFENNIFERLNGCDYLRIFGSNHIFRRNVFREGNYKSGCDHSDFVQSFGDNGGAAHNILFEENWIQNMEGALGQFNNGGRMGYMSTFHDFIFRKNVFINVSGNWSIGIPGVQFYNNTFYRSAYNQNGLSYGGAYQIGDSSRGIIKNNAFIAGGSQPDGGGIKGFYDLSGGSFNKSSISYVIGKYGDITDSEVVGISQSLAAQGYADTNGKILSKARELSSVNQFVLDPLYEGYKTLIYDGLVKAVQLDDSIRSTFVADYNFVAGTEAFGYAKKRDRDCVQKGSYVSFNFCEANGINGGDPLLFNINDPDGVDDIPFTLDDGLKPRSILSPLCGKGEDKVDMGVYSCDPNKIFAVGDSPLTPSVILGDVSGNGKVTTYDVTLVLRYTLGSMLSDVQKQKADINGDGKIDGVDVVGIARKAMGL